MKTEQNNRQQRSNASGKNQTVHADRREGSVSAVSKKRKGLFSIDFDRPLTVQDQLVIMIVVLVISLCLFSLLYLIARMRAPAKSERSVAAEVSSVVEDISRAEQQIQQTGPDEFSSQGSAVQPSEQEKTGSEPSESSESSDRKENSKEDSKESSKESHAPSEPEVSVDYPDYFGEMKRVSVDNVETYHGDLILVNKDHSCRYNGEHLVSLLDSPNRKYDITDGSVTLDEKVVPYFERMMSDFYDLNGPTDIMVACGFRSMEMQAELFDEEIEEVGEEEAERLVAPPGYSEHQTGLVFDLTLNVPGEGGIRYENVEPYSWINNNCYQYGFIVRYPEGKEDITGYSYESWHFRYVGTPSAYYMAQNDLTLEEYLDLLHKTDASDPLKVSTIEGDYALFYVPSSQYDETTLPVPDALEYTVSGDNDSGFIVTVALS